MNDETKLLLMRWQSLRDETALQRVNALARRLQLVGLALCLFIAGGIVYSLHPALIAIGAAVLGWVIAERNALRTRLSQWPIFRDYIDWQRVEHDLAKDTAS